MYGGSVTIRSTLSAGIDFNTSQQSPCESVFLIGSVVGWLPCERSIVVRFCLEPFGARRRRGPLPRGLVCMFRRHRRTVRRRGCEAAQLGGLRKPEAGGTRSKRTGLARRRALPRRNARTIRGRNGAAFDFTAKGNRPRARDGVQRQSGGAFDRWRSCAKRRRWSTGSPVSFLQRKSAETGAIGRQG
jgi:hypothetical protein